MMKISQKFKRVSSKALFADPEFAWNNKFLASQTEMERQVEIISSFP